MKKRYLKKSVTKKTLLSKSYNHFLSGVVTLLEEARHSSARSVNSIMTSTYWEIGRRIVETEQRSANRSEYYGEEIIERLATDLTQRFGRGFGRSNLFQMRAFFTAFSDGKIVQTVSGQSSLSQFPLSWSHYVKLLSVDNINARKFYHTESLRSGWSYSQLERQINTQFYERAGLSRDKIKMLTKSSKSRSEDKVTTNEEIKNPFVLEFLNLKDEYSESELEDALVRHLESFLMELGSDFAFIGRQKRLRLDDEWFKVDLVFFHRSLKCLVLVDLKIGKFTHADAGQMHMYLNYAKDHWTRTGENPPVGLILCAKKGASMAKYSLQGLSSKVVAAQYRTTLPHENKIVAELEKTQKLLENRIIGLKKKNYHANR